MWNQDERDGKIDRAKGKVKAVVGGLMHDDDLKAERQGSGERRGNRGSGAPQGRAGDREGQERREAVRAYQPPITEARARPPLTWPYRASMT